MPADRAQLNRAVHAAKRSAGLDDDTYREKLREKFGVASSKELTDDQMRALLTELNGGKTYRPKSKKPYVRMIFALWSEMCRQQIPDNRTRKGLIAFVKRMTQIDDPDWLDYQQASVVIEALKDWQRRELEKAKKA
jgi:phage gp16-like protein